MPINPRSESWDSMARLLVEARISTESQPTPQPTPAPHAAVPFRCCKSSPWPPPPFPENLCGTTSTWWILKVAELRNIQIQARSILRFSLDHLDWRYGQGSEAHVNDGTYFSTRLTSQKRNVPMSKWCHPKAAEVECEARRPRIFTFYKPKKNFNKKAIHPPKNLFFGMSFSGEKVSLAKNHHPLLSWKKKHSDPSPSPSCDSQCAAQTTPKDPMPSGSEMTPQFGSCHPRIPSMDPRPWAWGKEDVSQGFLLAAPQGKKGNKNDHNNQLEEKIRGLFVVFVDEEDVITRLRVRCVTGRNTKLSYEKKDEHNRMMIKWMENWMEMLRAIQRKKKRPSWMTTNNHGKLLSKNGFWIGIFDHGTRTSPPSSKFQNSNFSICQHTFLKILQSVREKLKNIEIK